MFILLVLYFLFSMLPHSYLFALTLSTPSVVYIPFSQSLYLLMHCSHLPVIMVYRTCHINSCFTAAQYHLDTHCVSHTTSTVTWQSRSPTHVLTVTLSGMAGRQRDGRNDEMWCAGSLNAQRDYQRESASNTQSLLWLQCVWPKSSCAYYVLNVSKLKGGVGNRLEIYFLSYSMECS